MTAHGGIFRRRGSQLALHHPKSFEGDGGLPDVTTNAISKGIKHSSRSGERFLFTLRNKCDEHQFWS
jgi:hypothetical protein